MPRHDQAGTAYAGESRTTSGLAPELPALERTDLLHRMMVLRRLAALSRPPRRPGTEAVVAGIGTALGPADTLLIVGRRPLPVAVDPPPRTVSVQLARFAGPDRVCALFTRHHGRIRRTLTVEGWDVEAVAAAAAGAAQAVRAWDSTWMLTMVTGAGREHLDPIAALIARMRLDHQLDENAVAAIEFDARRVAGRLIRPTSRRRAGTDGELSVLAATAVALSPGPATPERARRVRR
ncbi:hypothetical protein [Actinoplanes sp. L3-i22]|uniref:hypothetical protein n=1 Tax=Actinoplanes sp. L3-i22 TaxID=2836373 RepID=UPI001C756FD0|nr:hypothetical protein [Actinoplanes sp. L3-i22]BCY09437.1 hypothetical protein L3i22_045250 [Actinoplanes sp. L3-i22]